MNTLQLDGTWDLVQDVSGDIAMLTGAAAQAQDAASTIKLFQAELWYDTTQGIPYFQQILGRALNIPLLKAKLAAAALTVPGVSAAVVFLTGFINRNVSGQVQITDANGQTEPANF